VYRLLSPEHAAVMAVNLAALRELYAEIVSYHVIGLNVAAAITLFQSSSTTAHVNFVCADVCNWVRLNFLR